MADRSNDTRLVLRLPAALRARLEAAAQADRRPLSAYVRLLLERGLDTPARPRRTASR